MTAPRATRRSARGLPLAVGVAASFFALLSGLVVLGHLPATLLAVSALLSIVAFVMYGEDKSAAEEGRWRISESTLHVTALLGGWPGALVAQRFYRHKTTKQEFLVAFGVTIVVNCAALAWFVYETPVALP